MASDNEVKIVLTAKDQTKGAIESAKSGISGLTGTVAKFATAAGIAFAAKGIYDFGKAAVAEFADSEAAIARFTTTVMNVQGATKATADQLLAASQAAVSFGFSDEQAAENLGRFYARTKDVNEALEINKAAMDLAAAKNISLSDAGTILQQVYSGQARGLRDLGIQLEDGVVGIDAIKTAWSNFAGSAANSATTFQGQMNVLNETFGNFKEEVGGALAESIKPFITEITAFVSDPQNVQFFIQMAKAIAQLIEGGFKVLRIFVTGLKGDIEILSNVFAGMIIFWNEKVIPAANQIKAVFQSIVDVVQNLVDKFNAAKNAASNFLSAAGSTISGAATFVAGAVGLGGKRALGGAVSPSSAYLVGERGPELFIPSTAGSISPNFGGGSVINITMQSPVFLDQYAQEKMVEYISKALKDNLRI